ncbi:hypothetical protein [Sediminicurvatus halobius]|nr:hypothetical protein [Spiribacter halobius]
MILMLFAMETLEAAQVIFTQKTGTLMENRRMLQRLVTAGGNH